MGSTISYFYNTGRYVYKSVFDKNGFDKKLCNEILFDNQTFLITIIIRCNDNIEKKIDDLSILDIMQYTGPYISYMHNKLIYLLYDGSKQPWTFRSNISGDIISIITSDITKHCINNNLYEPYLIEIHINVQPYQTSLNEILKAIKDNNYLGRLIGNGSNI